MTLANQVVTRRFLLYITNCNDVIIIPFILSRPIFLIYFSVNVNQIIMEQQMATTYI